MPLGGIGAGSVELRPDGYFYNWYLMNNAGWATGPATTVMEREGLRFALSVKGPQVARTFALGSHYGLDPVPDGWFWFMDPYHIPWVEHPVAIEYAARIPVARLAYRFKASPLAIALTAWSPLIPHDTAASNTPGLVLEFTLANRTAAPLDVSLVSLLKNPVGYDRPDLPGALIYDAARQGLLMSRRGLPEDHVTAGEVMLTARADDGDCEITYALYPRHGRDLWDPLAERNRLENADYGGKHGFIGEVGAETTLGGPSGFRRGALCASLPLAPGATRRVTVRLTWHFPNHWELKGGTQAPARIGHQYAKRFASVAAVNDWLVAEHARLERETVAFNEAFFASDLPDWMLRAMNAQLSPLLRCAWYDRRGRFGIWEGLGRCGLQTVDVSHYASHWLALLFPDLDAAQQRLVAANCNDQGKVPHTMHGVFEDGAKNCDKRIDLCAQFPLAVWRHTLWTGDLALARAAWPVIVRNLAILAEKDADGDGLPDAVGRDQTYDKFDVVGSSALINFGYVPALLAAAELGRRLGHADLADAYADKARRAFDAADAQLWNGAYYDLARLPGGARNRGCLTDQVNGDWFYHQTCGRSCLPPRRVGRLLRAILKHNRRVAGPERWLVNCAWPAGDTIPFERNGSDQANSPWSGVEYAFAAYLILNGRRAVGRRVMRDVWERYERAGMRFDHYECGEFYHRGMSAFAVYLAEFGIVYNGLDRTLRLDPPAPVARFVLLLPGGWARAVCDQPAGVLRLSGGAGSLPLARATLADGRVLRIERAPDPADSSPDDLGAAVISA